MASCLVHFDGSKKWLPKLKSPRRHLNSFKGIFSILNYLKPLAVQVV